jgi:hypothetical protein
MAVFTLVERDGAAHSFHVANVTSKTLRRYLAEFDFRYRHRKVSDTERTEALVRGMAGKRLLFQQPSEAANA